MSRGDFIHLMTKFRMVLTTYKSLKVIVVVFVRNEVLNMPNISRFGTYFLTLKQ